MCDEPLVRLPVMKFVHAVHLSHIHETNQRCLEPAIFFFEGFQLIKMRSTKVDGLPEEKKWRKSHMLGTSEEIWYKT
jgi:hypothetical protein